MTKYYTMKKCFDDCGDNDIPFISAEHIKHGYNITGKTKRFISENNGNLGMSVKVCFSDKWQIKRAEPKVLTAGDYIKTEIGLRFFKTNREELIAMNWGKSGFKNGDKNGQLKEWLRHKELREAVAGVFTNFGESNTLPGRYKRVFDIINTDPKAVERIYDALENLKQLKAE